MTVGFTSGIIVTRAVRAVRHRHPDADVQTAHLNWDDVHHALLDHRVDAVVTGCRSRPTGCGFADVVRVRYLLPDRGDFEPCWPVPRRAFGEVRSAATMMMRGLADPRRKIEIEVYARRGGGSCV